MATMISEVYDALRSAEGVSDDQARKAAEAVASYDQRFVKLKQQTGETRSGLEARIAETRSSLEARIAETRHALEVRIETTAGRLRVVQAMLGVIIAGVATLVVRSFFQ